jgi:two-component system C4-dicarboxylate transport sensor histidine kinase DctB
MMNSKTRFTPGNLLLLTVLPIFLIIGLIGGYRALSHQALLELGDQSRNHLILFVSNLSGALAKYEHLPRLISTNPRLVNTLRQAETKQKNQTNRYLQAVATTSGASDVYLMNADGLTIAASNWNLDRSFIGQNFSFRPYFESAIKGIAGRYFALGTTSLQRGYYFSYPVFRLNQIKGVIVVKINLADIETTWSDRGYHFIVTDEDGIVFLSTNPDWTYKTIQSIDPSRLDEIHRSRRYAGHKLEQLDIIDKGNLDDDVGRVSVSDNNRSRPGDYLHLKRDIPAAGWSVSLFSNTKSIRATLHLRAALAGFGVLIALLLVTLYLVNRQRRLALQGSTELLEQRVQRRTHELENEVEERRKAEQTLRDTQAELIQAAKLAGLGQMSAGISHELNQPLTAIRNYSENAQRLLEREQVDAAADNLHEISELTGRMASIISQLRGFSRKSSGERSRVSIDQSINQAMGLFRREIESSHVEVESRIDPDLSVITDPLLLNQVLVNLFSNAIQAMAAVETHEIEIDARNQDHGIVISISDTGPGIASNVIENIFDPFFTTKEVGLGLGLGLSISYRIMESLGGRIEVANNATGGARFELYLPDE